MFDFQDALSKMQGYVDSGDNRALSKSLRDLNIALVVADCHEFPDDFFNGLLSFLKDPRFLALKGSSHLPDFLRNSFEAVTEGQRGRLRPVLAAAFSKYQNWLGAFITAEILGEQYPDEKTLAVFGDLSRTAKMPERALVPHGLECLARTTADKHLRASAIELLRAMTHSEISDVRMEATTSLGILGVEF